MAEERSSARREDFALNHEPKPTPPIAVGDLSAFEILSENEMREVYGAGRYRPMLEALEDRRLLSATSTLPVPGTTTSVPATFNLGNNLDLTETIHGVTYDLGGGVQGLFQSHDAAGHQVVYVAGNDSLYEFTPTTNPQPTATNWVRVADPNPMAFFQDSSLDLFFEQQGGLYEATGVPTNGAAGQRLIVRTVQSAYQAEDSSGHALVYAVAANNLYEVTGTGLHAVGGLPATVSQVAVNGLGQFYALEANGALYTVTGTTATRVATGVTQLAADAAGEIVVLNGPNSYTYFIPGGLETSGSSFGSNGVPTQYTLGYQGQLYALTNGVATVMATSTSTPQQLATGVTQMAVDSTGEFVVLQGPQAYTYFLPSGLEISGAAVASSSGTLPQYLLDAQGDFYTLENGVLTVATTSTATPTQVATGVTQIAANPAGEVIVLEGPHTYQFFDAAALPRSPVPGQIAVGSGGAGVTLNGSQFALDNQGRLYELTAAGVLFVSTNILSSGFQSVTTGVTQVAPNAAGGIVALKSNGTVWNVNGTAVVQLGEDSFVDGGTVWYLGVTPADSAGNRPIYTFSDGQIAQLTIPAAVYENGNTQLFTLNAVAITLSGGATPTIYAVDASGNVWVYTALQTFWGYNASGQTVLLYSGTAWTGQGGVTAADGSVWFGARGSSTLYCFSHGQLQTVPTVAYVAAVDESIWYIGADGKGGYAVYHIVSGGTVAPLYETTAAIGTQWFTLGGPDGTLGLPTGPVKSAGGLTWQAFQGGYVTASAAGTDALLSSTAVAGSGGTTWFLGFNSADSAGDHHLYELQANGTLAMIAGLATQLSASGGTPATTNAQGGLSVLTPQGLVSVFKGLQGLTAVGNGEFAITVGSWLTADVSFTATTNGNVNVTFSDIELNTGTFFGGLLAPIFKDAATIGSALAPLTQTIVTFPSQLGGGSLTVAEVLEELLQLDDKPTTASEVSTLASVATTLQGLGSLNDNLGTIALNGFTVSAQAMGGSLSFPSAASAALALPSALSGLLQQLQTDGIAVPVLTNLSQFLTLVAGNPNVVVATYTPTPISVPVADTTVPIASLPVVGPLTIDGSLEASLNATLSGSIGITASGALSPGRGLTFALQGDAGLAVEIALGVVDFSAGGYAAFAGLQFNSTIGVTPSGLTVTSPPPKPVVSANWVGPDFDLEGLINVLAAANERLSQAIANETPAIASAISNAPSTVSQVVTQWTNNTPFDPSTWNPANW